MPRAMKIPERKILTLGRPRGTMTWTGDADTWGGTVHVVSGITGTAYDFDFPGWRHVYHVRRSTAFIVEKTLKGRGFVYTHTWGWAEATEVQRVRRAIDAGHLQLEL